MKVNATADHIRNLSADWLAVGVYQDEPLSGAAAEVDGALSGALSDAIAREEWTPERIHTWEIHTLGRIPARKVLALGLGRRSAFDANQLRRVAGKAIQAACSQKATTLALWLPDGLQPDDAAAQAATEGVLLGAWQFPGYKREDKPRRLPDVLLGGGSESALKAGIARGEIIAEAQNLTRDLGWRPSNFLYPESFAQEAQERGEAAGLSVEVFDPEKLAELGMGALLGVGQGSAFGPRMAILRYRHRADAPTLALVGKGITFDSGGISIKPALDMDEMKYDMLGAGAVMGAMMAIARLKPALNVIGILCLAQNMPSATSYKPGDVVKAFNGKTIEILNTDAEGRVALSDGVSYAVHLGANWIVEASTLTGAALIALGHEATAMVATDQALADTVRAVAEEVGERIWQLPAYPEFKDMYKSDIADLNNHPGRNAGTITAGMIVSEFAGDVPFVHLDIAGTAWTEEGPLNAKEGATGVMVRTFARLAERLPRS